VSPPNVPYGTTVAHVMLMDLFWVTDACTLTFEFVTVRNQPQS